MNTPEQSQLGKSSAYVDQYDASLLFPIPRAGKRREIGIAGTPNFFGADLWTAFELSWLNMRGKPQVAIAHITVPCDSINIVESKSFKLYLNSFNNSQFADADSRCGLHAGGLERCSLATSGRGSRCKSSSIIRWRQNFIARNV